MPFQNLLSQLGNWLPFLPLLLIFSTPPIAALAVFCNNLVSAVAGRNACGVA